MSTLQYEITGNHNGSNNQATLNVAVSGTHNGANNAVSLTDTTKNFKVFNVAVGDTLQNTTDGSSTTITAITTTTNSNDTLVGVLAGGGDNDWDIGDAYVITPAISLLSRRVHTGDAVYNLTDGSSGAITGVTATTVTATLAGGVDNDWDNNDSFRIWVSEPNLIRFTCIDTRGFPMGLEASIASPQNVVENTYRDYQKIRVVEGDTSLVLFSGKIEGIGAEWDEVYGQIVKLSARDNLSELAKRVINKNYSGFTYRGRRSSLGTGLINQLVIDHRFASTNINEDTANFETSTVSETPGVLDMNYVGTGKTVLKAIHELANEDPWDVTPTGIGADFYLDTNFSGSALVPRLHYFDRGTRPTGGAAANGLTVQLGATETDQVRSMFMDYLFPQETGEIISLVRIEFVDDSQALQTRLATLIEIGNTVGGPFTVGEILLGGTSNAPGVVEFQSSSFLCVSVALTGTHTGANNAAVLTDGAASFITNDVVTGMTIRNTTDNSSGTITNVTATTITATLAGGADNDWDTGDRYVIPGAGRFQSFTVGETITGELSGATAAVDRIPRQSYEQDIEVVVRGYNVTDIAEARKRMSQLLHQRTNTITRGTFRIARWPFFRIGGNYTLVRAGDVVRVVNSNVPVGAGTLNEDMMVTKITYDEGPNVWFAQLDILRITNAKGTGAEAQVFDTLNDTTQTALWNSFLRTSSGPNRVEVNAGGFYNYIDGTLRTFVGNVGVLVRGQFLVLQDINAVTRGYVFGAGGGSPYVTLLAAAGTDLIIQGTSGDRITIYTGGGIRLDSTANVEIRDMVDLTGVAAGSPNLKIAATTDVPATTWGAAAGNEASAGPTGYLEIDVGGVPYYIPFWT